MQSVASTSPLGAALAHAIAEVRATLGDKLAPIVVLVPAGPNGTLARRALATQGPILRVWFESPDGLMRDQLPASSWKSLRPEPAGWLRVTLARLVHALAAEGADGKLGRFGPTLTRSGWRDPLTSALARLERDGITDAQLRALPPSTPAHIRERAELLAVLLAALTDARKKEKLASAHELARAATDAVGHEPGVGAALARGAVVLGDRELSFSTFTFLKTWLSSRPVARLRFPQLTSAPLAPAPWGLAEASAHATLIDVAPSSAAHTFVRTPDDVRECVEAVREVQKAIDGGTPLDRIAIVLPDSAPRGALEEALERAAIPCTWLMGFPAKELMTARLLRLALQIGGGEETPLRLYELLTHPALSMRAALGPDAVKGRGRWRRMLSDVARARGLDNILAGLERRAPPVAAAGPALDEDGEREAQARAALLACTRALKDALALLAISGPLGAHARAWKKLVLDFARPGDSRGRVLALLEPLASSSAGPALSPAEAREELESLLEREVAQGNLSERSIRVLPPLYLLGGEMDVVLMLGLTEGRFPKRAREDAVLPDALLSALSLSLGRALPLSRELEQLERRRFAAALGAAQQRAWLSMPALDFETERPTLPSTLALEALSVPLKRRARFGDVENAGLVSVVGSRARTWPQDASTAVGALDHLIARLASQTPDVSARAIAALAAHVVSKNVLQLHRSMSHARADLKNLDAWTGRVPPSVLRAPGIDGTPIPLRNLVALYQAPGAFFFRQMLGAFPPARLTAWGAPLERRVLEELVVQVAQDMQAPQSQVLAELSSQVLARLSEQHALGAFSAEALTEARPMVDAITRALAPRVQALVAAHSPTQNEGALRVHAELPWQVTELEGRVVQMEGAPVLVDVKRESERVALTAEDRPDLVLGAFALAASGVPVEELRVVHLIKKDSTGTLDVLGQPTEDQLVLVTALAQAGHFPVGAGHAFSLAGDASAPTADAQGDETPSDGDDGDDDVGDATEAFA